jgi:hypothetical protein
VFFDAHVVRPFRWFWIVKRKQPIAFAVPTTKKALIKHNVKQQKTCPNRLCNELVRRFRPQSGASANPPPLIGAEQANPTAPSGSALIFRQ